MLLYDLSSIPIFAFLFIRLEPDNGEVYLPLKPRFAPRFFSFPYFFTCVVIQLQLLLSHFRYRVSNKGKFPSVNLTHKEVGGSYYIVREIVRDIIQENRVLGPGGLNAKTLSFEDCPDPSEVSTRHELGQDSIQVLDMSDKEEAPPLQTNFISTQQLLGSSTLLESVILNSVVQNGNAGDETCLEENLEKQDEALYEKSRESENDSSEIQAPSLAYVSDSHKEIELDTVRDAHDSVASSINDEVTLFSDSSPFSHTTLHLVSRGFPPSILHLLHSHFGLHCSE